MALLFTLRCRYFVVDGEIWEEVGEKHRIGSFKTERFLKLVIPVCWFCLVFHFVVETYRTYFAIICIACVHRVFFLLKNVAPFPPPLLLIVADCDLAFLKVEKPEAHRFFIKFEVTLGSFRV